MKQLLAFIVRILSQNYVNVVKQFLIQFHPWGRSRGIFWYLYCFGGNWFHVNYLVNCCTAAAFNFFHNLLSLSEFSLVRPSSLIICLIICNYVLFWKFSEKLSCAVLCLFNFAPKTSL